MYSITPQYSLLDSVKNYLLKIWTHGKGDLINLMWKTDLKVSDLCNEVSSCLIKLNTKRTQYRATIEEIDDKREDEKTR